MNAVVALAGGKLSKVVYAMCDGLLEAADREDFRVDMGTYGDTADFGFPDYVTCYGCAATCALMKVTGVQLTSQTIEGHSKRAAAVGLSVADVADFERAVDAFRCGDEDNNDHWSAFWSLAEFCSTPRDVVAAAVAYSGSWELDTETWRDQLPILREFADYLAERGY